MVRNPRARRRRRLLALAMAVAGAVVFVGLFCRGPTGLFSIIAKRRLKRQLERETTELKRDAVLLRSDIERYREPGNAKRILDRRRSAMARTPGDTLSPGP